MNIVVLAGGISTERSVSIVSGTEVCKALRARGERAILLDVYCGKENAEPAQAFTEEYDTEAEAAYIHSFDDKIEDMIASGKDFFGPNVLNLCKYLRLVERYNEELGAQVKEKTARLVEVQNDIIVSMASIVENRDNNTGGHIRRTSDVVRVFVEHLLVTDYSSALTREIADKIIKAAPLHDFGKIAIPDSILNKPGKFVSEEYEIMKLHSQKGAEIVARILQNSDDLQFKNIAVNVAHYHHEKWDGTGYPCGLVQEEIPLEARIMALADVFDALVSNRIYKGQFSFDKAFGIIEESSGSHFDPSLCKAFLQCRLQIETLYG